MFDNAGLLPPDFETDIVAGTKAAEEWWALNPCGCHTPLGRRDMTRSDYTGESLGKHYLGRDQIVPEG